MKSRAIVFEEPRKVAHEEIDLPDPTSKDIVVKTLVSGVSVGTERWAFLGLRAEIKSPNVPGYMAIGEVLEVGSDARARGYREGARVNFFASRLPEPWGPNSWMGAHLSHAVVDVCTGADWDPEGMNIHRCEMLPDGMDPVEASLCGLCAVAMRGIEMATIPVGVTVLVVGLGVIGQYAAQVSRLKGAKVAVTDIVESRLEVAGKLGAEWVINSRTENLHERARQIAPGGFDIIIDTSSKADVVNSLFPLLKLFGKFVFQGWYPPPSELDLNVFHGKLPTCYFPCAHSGRAVAAAMRLAGDKKLDTRSLITHTAKPGDAAKMYGMIERGSEDFLGVIFDWRS